MNEKQWFDKANDLKGRIARDIKRIDDLDKNSHYGAGLPFFLTLGILLGCPLLYFVVESLISQ